MVGGDARGVAVHTAARVMAQAGPAEVLVSGATRELLGDAMGLEPAGSFELKGLSGPRELFRARGG
jgi:class 3 adenylate cyclase